MGKVWRQWCYHLKFLEEIRLHCLFHVGFGEISFLKWHDVINSNQFKFLGFGMQYQKSFQDCAFKLIISKNWYFMCQILRAECQPNHPLVSVWCKLWEDLICERVTPKCKQASFFLSHALDGLFSVLSRLHGVKQKCTFCWMKDHWTWLLSDIVAWDSFSFWHGTHYFYLFIFRYCRANYRCCDSHFPWVGKYIFP